METTGFFYFKVGTRLSDLSGGGGGGRRRTILCKQMGVNWGNLTIAPTPPAAEVQSFIVLTRFKATHVDRVIVVRQSIMKFIYVKMINSFS